LDKILETALTLASLALALCALVGLAVKYVAAPWFLEHVVKPVKETNRQVTVNKHESNPPTLLDKVDTLQSDLDGVRSDVKAGAQMYEGHIEASGIEWGHVWDALEDIRKHTGAPPFKRKRHPHD
jgi:outer membrane murein-binding lipoprotein Lpp